MSNLNIALNRFGYGLRRGESSEGNPARYLYAQMDAFDAAPSILAGREDTSSKAGEILEILRNLRRERQSQAGDAMNDSAMEAAQPRGADPLNGLLPDVRQSYQSAARTLREDAGLRTRIAITSNTPMMERLVHFWSNHFSVTAQKPGTHFQVANHEFSAIRPHVLGKFSDMLKAAVLHPAMLLYLDQFQSIGPNSPFQQRREQRQARRQGSAGRPAGLNENLAREILELHTLGVDGGYDQADVTEFARALTGWTINGLARLERFSEPQTGGAAFAGFAHEPGSRQIMGRGYREDGASQALAVLDDLSSHPSTARFIAVKLARHFAGDVPPPALVDRLAADFLRSTGDLASLTRTLIDSPEVWGESPLKFRQPFEWLVSTLRMTGSDNLSNRRLSGALAEIGQMPWLAPSPAGYDDIEGSWAGADALLRRVELAERVARGAPSDDVLIRAEAVFPGALTDHTRTWLARAESGTQALALLLVSPEMMRR